MNANELANELINWYPKINLCVASAITLRQQAKEIEQLKVDVEHYADRWRSACGDLEIEKDFKQLKLRELTDKEILDAMCLNDTDLMILLELKPSAKEKTIQRGRALLKKASEK